MQPSISFCSTCLNRKQAVTSTLEHNLRVIADYNGTIEYNLVNFIKDEEGHKIHNSIISHGRMEFFNYYVCTELQHWHASVAKNTSHLTAAGSFIINLDCDNFIDSNAIDALLNLSDKKINNTLFTGFDGNIEKKWRPWKKKNFRVRYKFIQSRNIHSGSYGNIGLPKSLFYKLGGYDEMLPPMGGQDADLLKRAIAYQPRLKLLHIPATINPIQNTKKNGLIHTKDPNADWNSYNAISERKTEIALKDNLLKVNNDDIGLSVINGHNYSG